jgi:hypothetical protein
MSCAVRLSGDKIAEDPELADDFPQIKRGRHGCQRR